MKKECSLKTRLMLKTELCDQLIALAEEDDNCTFFMDKWNSHFMGDKHYRIKITKESK